MHIQRNKMKLLEISEFLFLSLRSLSPHMAFFTCRRK